MSLWSIRTVAPCMDYIPMSRPCFHSGPPEFYYEGRWWYNDYLVTCPRHYEQTTKDVANFFYEPGNDRLIAHILLETSYWPGWDARRYEFSAEDGSWLNRDAVLNRDEDTFIGIYGVAWTLNGTMGSYNKIYACRTSETKIWEVSWRNAMPAENGWWVDPHTWNPESTYRFAVVNRVDNLLAAASSWTLDCWADIGTEPNLFGHLRLPNVLDYLAYENRNYCWGITKDGVIVKADYQIPRWEMISTVQNPTDDAKGYAITFDAKRKQVVVFRWREDGTDGACQNQLEFYYPMVNPAKLTKPVPVTSLRTGKRIVLVSHLIGDAGEGLSPYTIEGEMVPPVEGRLVTPFTNTERSGRASFQYQAPNLPCTETLRLNTTVEEFI